MSGGDVAAVLGVVVLVLVAGFLGAADAALIHLGRAKALVRKGAETRSKRALARVLEHPETTLNTVVFVRMVCLLVVGTLTGIELADRWGAVGVLVGMLVLIVVVFVVAEAVPKTYALQHTERVALFVAPGILALSRVAPLRWAARLLVTVANVVVPGKGRRSGPVVSEEELLAMAGAAVESESIDDQEAALITSVIQFGDTVAREIMVPRPDMVTVPATMTIDDALGVFIAHGYSRVPVVGDSLDDVVGIAYAKDLIRADRNGQAGAPVRTVARPAHFVPETKPVAALMREMQDQKFHIAVLIDEYGGIAGLVTLEDLIEELVGDIVDEFDVEAPDVVRLPGGQLRVSAGLPIDELNELLGTELPDDDWDSVGGFVFGQLGHVPKVGEGVEANGFRFEAEAVDGHRISLVRVSPCADSGASADRAASQA